MKKLGELARMIHRALRIARSMRDMEASYRVERMAVRAFRRGVILSNDDLRASACFAPAVEWDDPIAARATYALRVRRWAEWPSGHTTGHGSAMSELRSAIRRGGLVKPERRAEVDDDIPF